MNMAKTIKSIICPQCNSTEATKQDDGTYVCKYCGAHFFIDDDTVTQNINVTVNVKADDNVKYSEPKAKSQKTLSDVIGRKTSKKIVNGCSIIFVALTIIIFIVLIGKSASKSKKIETNPKYNGTIAENLRGEGIYISEITMKNGKVCFAALTSPNRYTDNRTLKIIDAKSLSIVDTVDSPFRLKDLDFVKNNFVVLSDNRILKFDNNNSKFIDKTDSIIKLIPSKDSVSIAGARKVILNDSYYIEITISNGTTFFYLPYDEFIFTNEKDLQKKLNSLKRDSTFLYLKKELKKEEYSLYKIKFSYDVANEIRWDYLNESIGRKNARQVHPNIQSIIKLNEYKFTEPRAGLNSSIIYQDLSFALMYFEKNGANFISKINSNGKEIWTKQVDFMFYPTKRFGMPAQGIKGDSIIVMKGTWNNDYLMFNYFNESFKYLEPCSLE